MDTSRKGSISIETQATECGFIEIGTEDAAARYGDERVRIESGMLRLERMKLHLWPPTMTSLDEYSEREKLIARVDGVVAGRVILETVTYPLAELVNLSVSPAYQGRGVGRALVAEACRHAAAMGFLAIHLQVDRRNTSAQRLYSNAGFHPAQVGEMLRMVKFLDYPALDRFLHEHPTARLQSQRIGDRWRLLWADHVTDEKFWIVLTGGSCQAEGKERGPEVSGFGMQVPDLDMTTEVFAPREVSVGRELTMRVIVRNYARKAAAASCRLLLNDGCIAADGTTGTASLECGPEETRDMTLRVLITPELNLQPLRKVASYPSLPVGVQCVFGTRVFWMCNQLAVRGGAES